MIYDESHAEHLRNLVLSDGWKIMQQEINRSIEYHKSQLVSCKLEEVEMHRARIGAYKAVLAQPQQIIDDITENTVVQRS